MDHPYPLELLYMLLLPVEQKSMAVGGLSILLLVHIALIAIAGLS